MYRRNLFTFAATFAAACMLFHVDAARGGQDKEDAPAAAQAADRAGQAADRAGQAGAKLITTRLPAGFKAKEQDDPILVRSALDSIAEAAVKGTFDDVVERLVDQDRNRIGRFDDEKAADLRDLRRQFADKWKAKYNKEFDIDQDRLFARLFVIQGEVEDPAVAIRNWPLPAAEPALAAGARRLEDDARQAAERTPPDRPADRPAERPADRPGRDASVRDVPDQANANIEKGRDVAVAAFPASQNLPSLRVSMIQEAGGYKIDVPNSLTGEQLHRNLAEHLRHIVDDAAQWPNDINDAQLAVAHHAFAAIYGVQDVQQGAQPGGARTNRTGTD